MLLSIAVGARPGSSCCYAGAAASDSQPVRARPSAIRISYGVRGRHSVGCDASFSGHTQPSSLAFILRNQYHMSSQTAMRVPTALVAGTSGPLSDAFCGVMEGLPLNAPGAVALTSSW